MEAGPSYVHISKREIPHKLSELTRHLVVQRTNEKTKKKQHARLPAQVPASSVSRSPGGNNRQERERRSARPRRRETSSRLPRGRHRKREWTPQYKHRAHVAQRWTSSRADELYPEQHRSTSPTRPFRAHGNTWGCGLGRRNTERCRCGREHRPSLLVP